jgi:predicted ATPase
MPGTAAATGDAGGDSFARQVRDALAHLYDPAYLQTHPLAALVPADPGMRTAGRGKALRQILVEAIEATRPIGTADRTIPGSLIHPVLTLRYVEALDPSAVQERLGVSRSEYYREHQRGVDAVISLLWQQWQAETETISPPSVPRVEAQQVEPVDDHLTRHNLPVQLTSFVGRERELADVKQLLRSARLVTLAGAGGCGKTRLALQVAADLLDGFPDGAWFVDLAPLTDATLVPQAVAAALNVREVPGQDALATVIEYLRGRHVLLVLDNCEHLVDGCARLSQAILRGGPRVQILATSREMLGVPGETTWRVPSLAMPDLRTRPTYALVAQSDAICLFVDRARAVVPTFGLTTDNADDLVQICHRLDGIPLAIELAAARVRVLMVEQILARLADRFRFLTGGSRTALRRQQTLRATIDWSHDLLTEPERILLRRLSVFAGGWILAAAEAVGGSGNGAGPDLDPRSLVSAEDVLDLLTQLVDKSFILAEGQNGEQR